MNFEIKNGIATYTGTIDVFEMTNALTQAIELAKTEEIQEFCFRVPNANIDVISEFHQFANRDFARPNGIIGKGIIEPDGDVVIVRYTLKRSQYVSVVAIGATPRPSLNVPDPIDLAYRRVV